jgi:hypothetical protein
LRPARGSWARRSPSGWRRTRGSGRRPWTGRGWRFACPRRLVKKFKKRTGCRFEHEPTIHETEFIMEKTTSQKRNSSSNLSHVWKNQP